MFYFRNNCSQNLKIIFFNLISLTLLYITPTMKEVDELMEVKPEIIAMDATSSARPEGKTLDEFFHEVKKKYPNQLFMAD